MRALAIQAAVAAWPILAVALTVMAQLELWLVWLPDHDEATGPVQLGTRAVAAVGAVPLTASIALGARLAWSSLALAIPAVALLPAGPLETSVAIAVAISVAAFRAGAWVETRADMVAAALSAAGVLGATWLVHPGTIEEKGDLALLVLVLVGPSAAGLAIRGRRARETELEAAAARAEAARLGDARAAVADERARIARELHDVVAHAISVIVLQARGGRRSIERDPAAASQALVDIEATATNALAEMRRLVGVLRPGAAGEGLTPPPGLAELDRLVDGVREAGLEVAIRVQGNPVQLAPGVDLAAYRLVQEALTNTLRHASAASVQVEIRYLPDAIEVEVVDSGGGTGTPAAEAPADAGHGMIGMRERAALYGGSVEFGARPEGGFRVLARLPLGGEPG